MGTLRHAWVSVSACSDRSDRCRYSAVPMSSASKPAGMKQLTWFFLQHPIVGSVGGAAALFSWGYFILRFNLAAALAGAIAIFVLQWLLWRRNGWARRREEQMWPDL